MKVLVVEDEASLASAIVRILSEAGHTVNWAPDGEKGYDGARSDAFDLILLDVMLPKKNGWDIVAGLRAAKMNVPILMLTARDEVGDRVKGLNLGADDYLPKPFETSELLARVHALHRRDQIQKGSSIRIDDLTIDRQSRQVTRSGQEISLTRREYDLLEALATNQARVLSRETIQERVWGNDEGTSNTVDVFIGTLRRKIDAPFGQKLIHTVVGYGYVLRAGE
jgi:two-component system copper resistance phosphate regulon response regulator CusR